VARVDPEDRAKGVVRGVAAPLRAEGHAPDQLGIAEGLRAVRARGQPLELGERLFEEGERVADAVVVEEVLGGGDLPANLVQGMGGRRADAGLELLFGKELRSDPLREAFLELLCIPEQVGIAALTESDQRHPGSGHRTRGREHHTEYPAANRDHRGPPSALDARTPLACTSQRPKQRKCRATLGDAMTFLGRSEGGGLERLAADSAIRVAAGGPDLAGGSPGK
jgi:hypothetical protein